MLQPREVGLASLPGQRPREGARELEARVPALARCGVDRVEPPGLATVAGQRPCRGTTGGLRGGAGG
eukprot:3722126-Pyramimonas_sp.AAC.1